MYLTVGKILKVLIVLLTILLSEAQGYIALKGPQGYISLSRGIHDVVYENRTVTLISVSYNKYAYSLIEDGNVLVLILRSDPRVSVKILKAEVNRLGGEENYVITLAVYINKSCPSIARGWVKDPMGFPLSPVLEEVNPELCKARLNTMGFPLSPGSWATFSLMWKTSEVIVVFGPRSSITPSSNTSHEAKENLTSGLISSIVTLRNNNTFSSHINSELERLTSMLAIALGVVALVMSVVYEIGGRGKS